MLSSALMCCLTADRSPVLQEKAVTPLSVLLRLGSCPRYLLPLESRLQTESGRDSMPVSCLTGT